MKLCETHNIMYKGKHITTLRVFLDGSGDPSEEHTIDAISIDKHGIGRRPDPPYTILDSHDMEIEPMD